MKIGIPKAVKVLRLNLGLDQQSFSKLLKLTNVTISNYEQGHFVPSTTNLIKLEYFARAAGFTDLAAIFRKAWKARVKI
jgi:transcriptional regulator with XRE-family HTH domain